MLVLAIGLSVLGYALIRYPPEINWREELKTLPFAVLSVAAMAPMVYLLCKHFIRPMIWRD